MAVSRTSLWSQVGVAVFVVCICCLDFATATETEHSGRQKRGFRTNSASRVAHGYGKRGGRFLSLPPPGQLASTQAELDELEDEPILPKVGFSRLGSLERIAYEDDGSLATVDEFAQLLANHPSLAKAIVKKFIDVDRDGLVTTAELFRSTIRK